MVRLTAKVFHIHDVIRDARGIILDRANATEDVEKLKILNDQQKKLAEIAKIINGGLEELAELQNELLGVW